VHGSEDIGAIKPKVAKNEGLWLFSFSDMCLTLMCFFVLMISMMKPDKKQFENMNEGMHSGPSNQRNLKSLAEKLARIIEKKKISHEASVTYDVDGLRLEFKDSLVFDSGSADFGKKNLNILDIMMKAVTRLDKDYHVTIEGHTDNVPIVGVAKYPSNWELSAARGFSVMRRLQALGMEDSRVSVEAFAHTKPKVSYEGLQGKKLEQARISNRRVVLWIE